MKDDTQNTDRHKIQGMMMFRERETKPQKKNAPHANFELRTETLSEARIASPGSGTALEVRVMNTVLFMT
jgi:hypothetical protein